MPLGLFGGSSSKAQILPSEEKSSGGKHKSDKRDSCDYGRGTVLKLEKHVVTIEKKLAEGGFAIVYLVSDQKNRSFALKRQFVNEDGQQVDACKREALILSSLCGHKNIVQYVDHLIQKNKNGVYDCMLLTAYYKTSVLHQMNGRLAEGRFFSPSEILSIFCDMCEAVARLHHATTPLIHRDLKVENILVDDRNRAAPPIFVLCDFGSATTRVLSAASHRMVEVEHEIEKYTTLSYRSPEMVDLYSQKPIGTPSDIWAMGVMLYKLCYFCLPFGESAMAIQNGAFSFPSQPPLPSSIKAIIKILLTANPFTRPNIYQVSSLSFEAASRPCHIHNIHKVSTIPLARALAFLDGMPLDSPEKEQSSADLTSSDYASNSLVTTADDSPRSSVPLSLSTSVNPRLRPKPVSSVPRLPILSATSSPQLTRSAMEFLPSTTLTPCTIDDPKPAVSSSSVVPKSAPPIPATVTSCSSMIVPFEWKEDPPVISSDTVPKSGHSRNLSDGGTLSKSAFRPYSESTAALKDSREEEDKPGWNAFEDAPLGEDEGKGKEKGQNDQDEVDWNDPFRSAPFDPLPLLKERERARLKMEQIEKATPDSESDVDETRLAGRRSFSYEHIDGVGDDASSDSRGRTDGDTTEDTGKDGEGDELASTDGGETTDGGTMDDVSGSRPLLDDDELEEDDDEDVSPCPRPFTPINHSTHIIPPSSTTLSSSSPSIPPHLPLPSLPPQPPPRVSTNPFNPFLVSPEQLPVYQQRQPTVERNLPIRNVDPPPSSIISLNENITRSTEPSLSFLSSRAPATLPRQVTSLVPRPPIVTDHSLPPHPSSSSQQVHFVPSASSVPHHSIVSSTRKTSTDIPPDRVTFSLSNESRQCHSSLQYEKMSDSDGGDSVDTDDSGAGMCATGGRREKERENRREGKKKRRETDGGAIKMNKPSKSATKTTAKTSSQKALNASFVNVTFQSEDVDRF